uniref:FMP27 GFWDK domain-containing protein n=1 Tax=Picocystis salinarum TaxID=88271 RepID=A0A7S3XFA5_9CHLO
MATLLTLLVASLILWKLLPRIVSWAVFKVLGQKLGIREVQIKKLGLFRMEGVHAVFDRGKIEEFNLVSVGLSGSLRALFLQCSSVHRIKLEVQGLSVSMRADTRNKHESADCRKKQRKTEEADGKTFFKSRIFLRMISGLDVSLYETKIVLFHGVSTRVQWQIGPIDLSGRREGDTGTAFDLRIVDSQVALDNDGVLFSFGMNELSVQALAVVENGSEALLSGSITTLQAVLLPPASNKKADVDLTICDISVLVRLQLQNFGSSCPPQSHQQSKEGETTPSMECSCETLTLKLGNGFETCRLEEVSVRCSSIPGSVHASARNGEVRLTDLLLQELSSTYRSLDSTLKNFSKSSGEKKGMSSRRRTKFQLQLSTGKLIYGRQIPLGSSLNQNPVESSKEVADVALRRVASFATVDFSDLGLLIGSEDQGQVQCKMSTLVVSAHHQPISQAGGSSQNTTESLFALFFTMGQHSCSSTLVSVQRFSYRVFEARKNNLKKTMVLSGEQVSLSWDADSSLLAEIIVRDVRTTTKRFRAAQKSNKTKIGVCLALSLADVSITGTVGGGVLPSLRTSKIESTDIIRKEIEIRDAEMLLDGEEVAVCSKATIQFGNTTLLQPPAGHGTHISDSLRNSQGSETTAQTPGERDPSTLVSAIKQNTGLFTNRDAIPHQTKERHSSQGHSSTKEYFCVTDTCSGDSPPPYLQDGSLPPECAMKDWMGNDTQSCKVISITMRNTKFLLPLQMMLRDKIDDIETQIKAYLVSRKSVIHHGIASPSEGTGRLPRKPGMIVKLSLLEEAAFEIQQDSFEVFLQEQNRNLHDAKALETMQRELKKDDSIHSLWEHFRLAMERWRSSTASRGFGQGSLLRVAIREGYATILRGAKGQRETLDYCAAIRNLDGASREVTLEGELNDVDGQQHLPWTESAPKQVGLHGLIKDAELYIGGLESKRLKCSQITCEGVLYMARQKSTVLPSTSTVRILVGKVGRGLLKKVPAKGARPPVKIYSDIRVGMKGFHGHFAHMDLVTYADLAKEMKRLSKSSTRGADRGNLSPSLPWWDVIRYLWHGRLSIAGEDFTMAVSPHETSHGSLTLHSSNIDLQSPSHGHWTLNLDQLKFYRHAKGLSSQSWNLGELGSSSPLFAFPKANFDISCKFTRADGKPGEMHHMHLSASNSKIDTSFEQELFVDKVQNRHLPVPLFDHFRAASASACVLVNLEPNGLDGPACCLSAADLKWTVDLIRMLSRPPKVIREASKRRKFGSTGRGKRHPLAVGSPFLLIESLDINVHVRGAEVTFHDDSALVATMQEYVEGSSVCDSPTQGLRLAFETTSYSGKFTRRSGESLRRSLCPEKSCISSSAITLKLPPYTDSQSSCKASNAEGSVCSHEDPEHFAKLFDRLRKGQEASGSPPKGRSESPGPGDSFVLATELLICNILHRQESKEANAATDVVIDGLKAVWTKKTWDAVWCCFGSIYGNLYPKTLGKDGRHSSTASVKAQAANRTSASDKVQMRQGRDSLLSLLLDGKAATDAPTEEERIGLLVTVNQPQVTLDSEEGHGRILLSAAGGLLVRKKIVSTEREVGDSEQHKLSLSLEYVQMHVIPVDVDPTAGLLWLVSNQQMKDSTKGAPLQRSASLSPPEMSRAMFVPILSPCHMQLCHAKDVCAISGRRISHQLKLSSPEIQSTTSCRDFQALISVIAKLVIAPPPPIMLHAQLVREAQNMIFIVLRHGGLERIEDLMNEDHKTSNEEVTEAMQTMLDSFAAFKGTLQTLTHFRSQVMVCKSGEAAFHRIFCKDSNGTADNVTLPEASILLSNVQALVANTSGKLQKLAQDLCNSYKRFRRLALRGQLAPDLSLSFEFSQVDWVLTGSRGDEVGATLTSLSFVRLREEDGSAVSRFQVGSMMVKNPSVGNLILSPLLKGTSWRRDAAVRVFAEVAPPSALDPSPVNNTRVKAVYDHLEVNVMPHEICLEESIAEFLQSFFLPDAAGGSGSMVQQTDIERKSLLLPPSKSGVNAGKKHKSSLSLNDADFRSSTHMIHDPWDLQANPGSSTARSRATTRASYDSGPLLSAGDTPCRQNMPTLFRYVKVDSLSVQVSYTGAPISIHELKLVADARLYRNFLGTGQELLQRVKWDWTKSVLRSVAGLQHRKFRQLVSRPEEGTSTTRASPRRKRDAAVHSFLETDEKDQEVEDTPQSPDEKKAWLLFGHRYKGKR